MLHYKVLPKKELGTVDEKIYGQFIEHFHRIVYGGIYDPKSPFADEKGLRADVIEALRKIKVPVIRWPGGCFVSCYDWKKGIGKRIPYYDKAWRVEESNEFGTDEFMDFCEKIGAEAYICANAGTGTPEDISDWVEYCNLESEGIWAKKRIENGHSQPYNVKYWSIGNENYGNWEMGAKSPVEWGRYVKEAAKMMKRVDPRVEIMAASIVNLDWNIELLKEAGDMIDWISIHGYWDPLWQNENLSGYEKVIKQLGSIDAQIKQAESYINIFGYSDKIKIAFDEWNLRGWHHPNIHTGFGYSTDEYIKPRDLNDINSKYTVTDAVFSAAFLNTCIRHSDTVKMANFAPTVNVRGAIFTHKDGIVLRPTYHVFDMFVNDLGLQYIDSYIEENNEEIDAVSTVRADGAIAVSAINKDAEKSAKIKIAVEGCDIKSALIKTLNGASVDSYNDIGKENDVSIKKKEIKPENGILEVELGAHSVNVIILEQ